MPSWMAWGLRLWRGADAASWARHSLAEELAKIDDAQLRGVLGARWAEYVAPPAQAPLLARALATGVYNAASAIGVANTVASLAPDDAAPWQQAVRTLAPGISDLSLSIGLEGDIPAADATTANHGSYESEDIGAAWRNPADEDATGLFVAFPSLKDPSSAGQPTAKVVAFAPGMTLPDKQRPEEYLAFKAGIEESLLAQFLRHFQALKPMLRFNERSMPVTQHRYV
jgi:hypothetical protein